MAIVGNRRPIRGLPKLDAYDFFIRFLIWAQVGWWFAYLPLYAFVFKPQAMLRNDARKKFVWSMAMGYAILLGLALLMYVCISRGYFKRFDYLGKLAWSSPVSAVLFCVFLNAVLALRQSRGRRPGVEASHEGVLIAHAVIVLYATVSSVFLVTQAGEHVESSMGGLALSYSLSTCFLFGQVMPRRIENITRLRYGAACFVFGAAGTFVVANVLFFLSQPQY